MTWRNDLSWELCCWGRPVLNPITSDEASRWAGENSQTRWTIFLGNFMMFWDCLKFNRKSYPSIHSISFGMIAFASRVWTGRQIWLTMGTRDSAYISARELNAWQWSRVYRGKFSNQETRDGSADLPLFFLDTLPVQLLMICTRVLLSVASILWCSNSSGSHKNAWCLCMSRTTLCTLGLMLQVRQLNRLRCANKFYGTGILYLQYFRKESDAYTAYQKYSRCFFNHIVSCTVLNYTYV